MGDEKRPKPADEGAVTRRWRPGQELGETAVMPAVLSRRATVSMGSVRTDIPPAPPTPPPPSTMSAHPRDTLPPATVAVPTAAEKQDLELVIVEERQVPGGEKRPWRAAEVWTKRRVYGLDSTFKCVEIIDRESGRPETSHDMLGARLGGGRHREKDTVRFSYPYPLPGMEAMFMKAKKHGYTSPVERMVVRVRVLITSADETMPTWDDIGSRWSDLPPAK